MTILNKRNLFCASAALLASASITFASASMARADQVERITHSQAVAFGDLNLMTVKGAAVLKQRVDAAVNRVCGTAGRYDLRQAIDRQKCRNDATANADAEMNRVVAAASDNRVRTASIDTSRRASR